MDISLMVYEANGKYYASKFFQQGARDFLERMGAQEIFTLEGKDVATLEKEAKEESRRRGIAQVINLD